MSKIIVYTTDVCPKCKLLKGFFQSQEIAYEEMNMGTPDALTELAVNNVFTNVAPVLQIDETFLTHKEIFTGTEVNADRILPLIS
jgi:Glutaredoxin and related proteins